MKYDLRLYRQYRMIVEFLISMMITRLEWRSHENRKQIDLNELLDDCIDYLKLENGERQIIITEVEKLVITINQA